MSQTALIDRPTVVLPAVRPPATFRADVEGLRAVAVVLVVLFHAGVATVSGGYVGVDVFFVISGFLITSQLTRELAYRRSISISRFYARRALRLLPAATLTVAVTLAAAWAWLPPIRFRSIATDALTTTFYGINWRLAVQGTDYLVADAAPSPLQHFWSLAVEEQFYIVWPLLLLTASLAWRRRGPSRAAVVTVLIAVIAGSLTLSVWQTGRSAPWAYFGAHTRAWELALGALVAVTVNQWALLPRLVAIPARWLGLAAIVTAGLLFNDRTAFPGYAVALPVLGTALVIAVGCAHQGRVLGVLPLQALGKLSYSWYLWHWPVLIIGPYVLGYTPDLGQRLGLAGGALLLAVFSYVWVEDPVRGLRTLRSRPWKAIRMGAALSAALAGMAAASLVAAPVAVGTGQATDTTKALAAATTSAADQTLTRTVADSALATRVPANLTPALDKAVKDWPAPVRDGCNVEITQTATNSPCVYGAVSSTTPVVLFGDSHAQQWFPALDKVATQRGWQLHNFTKDACSAASVKIYHTTLKRPYNECVQWRAATLEKIRQLRPKLIVITSNGDGGVPLDVTGDVNDAWVQAWLTSVRALKATGARLVMLNDTPWPQGNAPDCVSAHLTDVGACARPRSNAVPAPTRRKMIATAVAAEGVTVIDPLAWFCTDKVCPAVIGNVLVYHDASHISATYAALLASVLGERLPTNLPSA